VREVGQPRRAEDQREPDRGDGDEQPEPQPVDQQLDGGDGAATGPAAAVVQGEVHRLPTPGVDRHRPGLLARQLDLVGQVVGVDRHLVDARAGKVHLPAALVVGLDGVDLVAALGGDGDLHTLDGAAAAGLQRAAQLFALRPGDPRHEHGQTGREDRDQQ
jgi:hypothetical protein